MDDNPIVQSAEPPLLSICIPTFNRASWLEKLLLSITKQPHPLSCEVRVRDNAGQDQTREVFHRIAGGRSNWFYERNEANIGGRANIRLCSKGARGKFVFIVGDDDQLQPNAFELIDGMLKLAQTADASALFAWPFLGKQIDGVVLRNGFEWLRYASINCPAFISSVIWSRSFWESYRYEDYPPTSSLPQLDCFINACLKGRVVTISRALVIQGRSEPTNKTSFWFYPRQALIDSFEYPTLYKKVLSCKKLDFRTWLLIQARRTRLSTEIIKKLMVLRENSNYYRTTLRSFETVHRGSLNWIILVPIAAIILKTRIGGIIAEWYCTRKGIDKLPARETLSDVF